MIWFPTVRLKDDRSRGWDWKVKSVVISFYGGQATDGRMKLKTEGGTLFILSVFTTYICPLNITVTEAYFMVLPNHNSSDNMQVMKFYKLFFNNL